MMKIDSPVLGTVEVAEDKVIKFPAGLPGFEDCRQFFFVHEEGGSNTVFMLQSVDRPEVMFSVAGPEVLGVHYEFPLSDEDVAQLQLTSPEKAVVAVILRKDGHNDSPSSAGLRANFMAPLIINIEARIGMQKILSNLSCEVTLRSPG